MTYSMILGVIITYKFALGLSPPFLPCLSLSLVSSVLEFCWQKCCCSGFGGRKVYILIVQVFASVLIVFAGLKITLQISQDLTSHKHHCFYSGIKYLDLRAIKANKPRVFHNYAQSGFVLRYSREGKLPKPWFN